MAKRACRPDIAMQRVLERITYVEDEPDIREIAQIALQTLGGFNLDVCCCGQEAIEKSPGFDPDLILLDVMMPEMDGVETFQKIRANPKLRGTPIIFMTAKAQPHEVQQYLDLGAAGIIAKPFDPIGLADQVRAIWDKQN